MRKFIWILFMDMIDSCAICVWVCVCCVRVCVFQRHELGLYEKPIMLAVDSGHIRLMHFTNFFFFCSSLSIEYSRLIFIFSHSDEYSRHWINSEGISL